MSITSVTRRRWNDNDHYFGPFTYARDTSYRSWAVALRSGDDEERGCSLRLSGFGRTLIIALPDIIKPWKEKFGKVEDPAVRARIGDHYYHVHAREFSVSFSRTGMIGDCWAMHLHYGPQTGDSCTEKNKCYFLSWTRWRHVRHSLYDWRGEFFATIPEKGNWTDHRELVGSCPIRTFGFHDFDGEALEATTRIEEREWRKGEGWFKWLSWFRKPIIQRSLNIEFSDETGEEKGSWKGGTMGHSISMLPDELHEAAFRRYCAEHKMTMVA